MVTLRRLGVLLCLLSACFAQHTPRKCADVPIPLSDGKTIHLSQYHGKVIMVVMMKTDCPECHQLLGLVSRLQQEMGPRGFQGLAIAVDDNPAAAKSYADRYRFPFPVGHLDPPGAIKLMELNASAHPIVPYVMFVDWEGNARFQYAGNDPIFNSGEKYIRSVADGLVRQAIEKTGPQLETRPAGKQGVPPASAQAASPAAGKPGQTTASTAKKSASTSAGKAAKTTPTTTGSDAKTIAASATAKQ